MATRYLNVAPELKIPAGEAETQTIVIYGAKGQGKTNLAAVLAEELADAGRRFVFLDPIGVSYGLRFGADGKPEGGIPIVILGGLHGDIPIEPSGGAVVADFVADETPNVLIDISRRADGLMWKADEKIRFVTAFASRLYQRQGEQRRPLMLLIDEAGRFVPQTMPKGSTDIAACVSAIEQLVELGRNVGVGVTLITQRSARMAKSVSELAELLIAFRTVGPNSVGAILDWFGDHVRKDRWDELVGILRTLPRGRALVVSPGWIEYEGTASIRLRRTFDSSRTPTGTERKMAGRAVRPANLDDYRARMAETVERAEATDPRKVRAELDKVRAELAAQVKRADRLEAAALAAKPTRELKARPLVTDAQLDRVEKLIQTATDRNVAGVSRIEDVLAMAREAVAKTLGPLVDIAATMRAVAAIPAAFERDEVVLDYRGPVPAAGAPGVVQVLNDAQGVGGPREIDLKDLDGSALVDKSGKLKRMVRALLTLLAQFPTRRFNRRSWHTLAGYSPSGDTSTAIADLIARGAVEDNGAGFTITPAGATLLGPFERLPTGAALRDSLIGDGSKLPKMERALLSALFAVYPEGLTRKDTVATAGYKASGDTSTALAKFVTLGWVTDTGRQIRASDDFYA